MSGDRICGLVDTLLPNFRFKFVNFSMILVENIRPKSEHLATLTVESFSDSGDRDPSEVKKEHIQRRMRMR